MIPKHIEILGHRFKVVVCELPSSDTHYLHGDCDTSRRYIRINASDSPGVQIRTLFHEKLHAILGISGVSNLLSEEVEEAIVVALENGLLSDAGVKSLIQT